MPQPQTTIETLYRAFNELDAEAMAACYAADACFEDEAFILTSQSEIAGMWRMLCQATRNGNRADWKLSVGPVRIDEQGRGWVEWEAEYRFGPARRPVKNQVKSRFTFDDRGLIHTQLDRFNFWRWSWQAMGIPGAVLGWSPMFRTLVRKQALANLERFMAQGKTGQ